MNQSEWEYQYNCKKCGAENRIVLGNDILYDYCGCGYSKFNDKEFYLDNEGLINKKKLGISN